MRTAGLFGVMALMLLGAPSVAQSSTADTARPNVDMQPVALLQRAKDVMSAKPEDALALTKQAEAILSARQQSRENVHVLAEALWLQGEAFLRLDNTAQATSRIEQAFALVSKIDDRTKLRGEILLSRGWLATKKADVAEALADYQTAYNIFQALHEARSQAKALKQIALLYREANDFAKSQKYEQQATEIYPDDPILKLSTYNNRGNELTQMKQPVEAEQQYRLALAIARKTKNKVNEASILRNIARVQIQSGQLAAAERTLATSRRVDNAPDAEAPQSSYVSLSAQLAFERGNTALAGRLSERYFADVNLATTDLSDRDAHETAYKSFLKLGNYDLALRHLEALKRLDDKTASLTASANTALKAADFDAANKDAKIANLKADEARRKFEFEQARSRMLGWIFAGVIVATLIVVSMLVFGIITIRRSRNEVRAANVDLADTNTALEKALAAKTEFLATTSHEIRTPLNGILGMTQVMLADSALSAATRDRLGVVHGAGVTMKALVDDILDVAKMETGNLTVEAVPVDLHKTLADVSRLWEEQARAKGVTFKIDLDQCPQMIMGDAARLRQIVFNLLSNALKFTEKGSIDLRATRTADGRLQIAVHDTGIGIPANKLDEIFESFKQVDTGTTRRYGGTGLGLSICRSLARAMGGDVTVTSQIGQGSTFAITLPCQPIAAPTSAPETRYASAELVIVDRNPITRSLLRALLAPHAPTIAFAESVAEAVSSIAAAEPKLVLVDESVVRADGDIDAALVALAQGADAVQARVCLLWANPSDEARQHFAAAGIDQVITKPVAGPALVASLFPHPEQARGQTTQRLVSRAA